MSEILATDQAWLIVHRCFEQADDPLKAAVFSVLVELMKELADPAFFGGAA